jgi:hypothetical protein
MTSKEMMRADCGCGHFDNIACLGDAPNWILRDYSLETIDPNYQTIFGYEEKAFLMMQYHE